MHSKKAILAALAAACVLSVRLVPRLALIALQQRRLQHRCGIGERAVYELPFTRAEEVGQFVRAHLPDLNSLLTEIERQRRVALQHFHHAHALRADHRRAAQRRFDAHQAERQ